MDHRTDPAKALLHYLIRYGLKTGEDVRVPGLGTFGVEHRASRVAQRPDGSVEMTPPHQEITFRPEH